MTVKSLLQYYQENKFNPVPIPLGTTSDWDSHFAKRHNLYQRHLGIPLSLLKCCSVLEFGCNSGENALVLASVGANLTLVEPNDQVFPRLKALFQHFGLQERIVELVQTGIDSFESETRYDIVLAEGFLYTLPNRDSLLLKISKLLNPGGFAVVAFGDRCSLFLEMVRRMVLWRAYQLQGINDVHSDEALNLAKRFYGEDFAQLNASRPFEVWWKDTMVCPFLSSAYHWSYPEILSILERAGCEFYSSSPQWGSMNHFNWYKNVLDTQSRHSQLLKNWASVFPFFLTGLSPSDCEWQSAPCEVINSVVALVAKLADYTIDSSVESIVYPDSLNEYLSESKDIRLQQLNLEMNNLYKAIKSARLEELLSAYHETKWVRELWGTPQHYICFTKSV
ncbi:MULTISPECIES: methyltransferase domain-containing protein [unclassified Microcoleus]|uniref:methyltransferase domain-containing protein n=1 Tax=unclassified Microcoleus TaxID=2642155 RepID=UPI002FD02F91